MDSRFIQPTIKKLGVIEAYSFFKKNFENKTGDTKLCQLGMLTCKIESSTIELADALLQIEANEKKYESLPEAFAATKKLLTDLNNPKKLADWYYNFAYHIDEFTRDDKHPTHDLDLNDQIIIKEMLGWNDNDSEKILSFITKAIASLDKAKKYYKDSRVQKDFEAANSILCKLLETYTDKLFDKIEQENKIENKIALLIEASKQCERAIALSVKPLSRKWAEDTIQLDLTLLNLWENLAQLDIKNREFYVGLVFSYIDNKNFQSKVSKLESDDKDNALETIESHQSDCAKLLTEHRKRSLRSHNQPEKAKKQKLDHHVDSETDFYYRDQRIGKKTINHDSDASSTEIASDVSTTEIDSGTDTEAYEGSEKIEISLNPLDVIELAQQMSATALPPDELKETQNQDKEDQEQEVNLDLPQTSQNNLSAQTTQLSAFSGSLFNAPNPQIQTQSNNEEIKKYFIDTLVKFLTIALEKLSPAHLIFNALLFEIACFHKDELKSSNATVYKAEMTQALFEKASILGFNNRSNSDVLFKFQDDFAKFLMADHHKNKYEVRLEKYRNFLKTFEKEPAKKFFWDTITKYIDRSQKGFNSDQTIFADLFQHLANMNFIKKIQKINPQIHGRGAVKLKDIFTDASKKLREHLEPRKTNNFK